VGLWPFCWHLQQKYFFRLWNPCLLLLLLNGMVVYLYCLIFISHQHLLALWNHTRMLFKILSSKTINCNWCFRRLLLACYAVILMRALVPRTMRLITLLYPRILVVQLRIPRLILEENNFCKLCRLTLFNLWMVCMVQIVLRDLTLIILHLRLIIVGYINLLIVSFKFLTGLLILRFP
jgi:hypothetical protein